MLNIHFKEFRKSPAALSNPSANTYQRCPLELFAAIKRISILEQAHIILE